MTYTVESLAAEQEGLHLRTFDYDFAWRLGLAMHDMAADKKWPAAITVAHGPDLVFAALLPGATPDNWDWAARKRAVAHRFHRSSLSLQLEAERRKIDFHREYRLPDTEFSTGAGGVPLIVQNGVLAGTVGVSGLPDLEDHHLIIGALRAVLARPQ